MRATPAQQRLADAIEKLADAEAYAAALDDRVRWNPAHREELSAAETALAAAQESATKNALARALGRPVSGLSLADAQAAVDAARTKYDAAERDRELIRAERDRFATHDLDSARRERDEATAGIMAPVITDLLGEFRRADARMAAIYQAITGLPVGFWPETGWSHRRGSLEAYPVDPSVSHPLTAWCKALEADPLASPPDLSTPEPLAEAAE